MTNRAATTAASTAASTATKSSATPKMPRTERRRSLTGQTVQMIQKGNGSNPWKGCLVPVQITGEYPTYLTGTVLPHNNPDGWGVSSPYQITIDKHSLLTGDVVIIFMDRVIGQKRSDTMTLRELKDSISDTEGCAVPTAARLEASGDPVATLTLGTYSITVYRCGFAVGVSGRRKAVIRVDECGGYTYRFGGSRGGKSGGKNSASNETPHHFDEEYFLDKPWPIRLMLAVDDQLQKLENDRERRWISKHSELVNGVNWLKV